MVTHATSQTMTLSSEELSMAAVLLRKYAAGVETKLYINMSVDAAHQEINAAERLASKLEAAAAEQSQFNLNK